MTVHFESIRKAFVLSAVLQLAVFSICWGQSAPTDITGSQMMGHRLTELAQAALSGRTPTHPAQIEQAHILLKRATSIDGSNPETWRLYAEAARMAGNQAELLRALGGYLKLRPSDDVAQYEMIQALLARQQTAEKRIVLLTKIAESKAAKQFTRALRSQVAMDAALYQLQRGENSEYARLLSFALALDATNKRAAAQAYTELVNRRAPANEIAAALFTLFNADPTDANTHALIAELLLAGGLYESAVSWFESHSVHQRVAGQVVGIEVAIGWVKALWGSGRVDEALQLIQQISQAYDAPASTEETAESDHAEPAAPKRVPGAPEVWPPLDVQVLRLAILISTGDQAAVEPACEKLTQQQVKLITSSPGDPVPVANMVWLQLLCGRKAEQAKPWLDKLTPMLEQGDPRLAALRGWMALSEGKLELAEKLLKPLAQENARAAYGLTKIYDQLNRPQEQKTLLQHIFKTDAADLFGLMAAGEARRLSIELTPPEEARDVGSLFANVPENLRNAALHANEFVLLQTRTPRREFNYAEPISLTLRLRNVSRVPLGLGQEQAIPTRVAVLPSLTLNGQAVPQLSPIVVDLHRALRLDAGRTLEVPVRLDSGALGMALDATPGALAKISAMVILNPRLGPNGLLVPGKLGGTSSVRGLLRRNWQPTEDNLDNALAQAGSSEPAIAMRAGAMLLHIYTTLPDGDETAAQKQRIANTLDTAFRRMPAMQRAWVLSYLNPPALREAMKNLLDTAARDRDELVQLIYLLTQVEEPDSPVLNAALRSSMPQLKPFAQATRTLLQLPPSEQAASSQDNGEQSMK